MPWRSSCSDWWDASTQRSWRPPARLAAEVRAKAARALGRLGAEDEADGLRAALGDRIPFVRATAAIALGMVADQEAGRALLEQARTDHLRSGARSRLRAGRRGSLAPVGLGAQTGTGTARRRGRRRDRREQNAGGAVSILREVLTVSSIIAFAYFAILNATYLVFTAIAWRDVTRYRRARSYAAVEEVFASPLTPPISVIVPAFNEEADRRKHPLALASLSGVRSDRRQRRLGRPHLGKLADAFELLPVRKALRGTIPTARVRAAYTSRRYRDPG